MSQGFVRHGEQQGTLQLGELRQVYRYRLQVTRAIGIFALLVVIPAILVPVVTFPGILKSSLPGWAIFLAMLALCLLFLGVPLLLIYATFVSWRRERHTIALYEQGIVEQKGRRSQVMRWPDVRFLWHHVTHTPVNGQQGPPAHSYEIEGGEKLKIHLGEEIAERHDLFQKITQQTTPYLLAQARERLQAGLDVPFGSLTVTPTGLVHHRAKQAPRRLPWNELESAQMSSESRTIIKQKGNWYSWFEGEIPNTETFQRLVKELQEPAEA
jgi:hypothetical protein